MGDPHRDPAKQFLNFEVLGSKPLVNAAAFEVLRNWGKKLNIFQLWRIQISKTKPKNVTTLKYQGILGEPSWKYFNLVATYIQFSWSNIYRVQLMKAHLPRAPGNWLTHCWPRGGADTGLRQSWYYLSFKSSKYYLNKAHWIFSLSKSIGWEAEVLSCC